MEGVIAGAPGHVAVRILGVFLVGLTVDANVHEVVVADGALVLLTLPLPHGDGVPFLNHELIWLLCVDFHYLFVNDFAKIYNLYKIYLKI